jgi:hypothetical protein
VPWATSSRHATNEMVVEPSFGRTRIAAMRLRSGSSLGYQVIPHPVPMDHTIQPSLFYCDTEAEVLECYEKWCEAEVRRAG